MKYEFAYISRHHYEIIQVLNGDAIIGSFNVPIEDIEFWRDVEEYIEQKQKANEPTHTRIN